MADLLKACILSQFQATHRMLDDCIRLCPGANWDDKVAKYPFWLVAYHTLYCLDMYLEPREEDYRTDPRFHPKGMEEIENEYPSKRFSKDELLAYSEFCHEKMVRVLGGETPEALAGPSGHARRTFSRAELHLYNMRHVQHHSGQLGAVLRRAGVDTSWAKAGWA
jgi:hypothetical protein